MSDNHHRTDVPCPLCAATVGQRCLASDGTPDRLRPHRARTYVWCDWVIAIGRVGNAR